MADSGYGDFHYTIVGSRPRRLKKLPSSEIPQKKGYARFRRTARYCFSLRNINRTSITLFAGTLSARKVS